MSMRHSSCRPDRPRLRRGRLINRLRWLLLAPVIPFAFGWILPAAAAEPSITLNTTSGSPGTKVTVSGSGFPPGEVVALYIDSPGPFLGIPGPKADAQGSFRYEMSWPGKEYDISGKVDPAKPGLHTVCGDTNYPNVSPPLAAKACAQFQVQSIATPAPGGASLQGAALTETVIAIVVLAAIALGVGLWIRSAK